MEKSNLVRAWNGAPATINVEERSAEFVCSAESVDSYGTVIRQDWKLDRFMQNPVALYSHNPDMPIGRWENVRVEDGRLLAKLVFAKGVSRAEECWALVEQGMLRGASVGFKPGKKTYQRAGDKEVPVYSENELYEISLVSQPSNAEALARQDVDQMEEIEVTPAAETVEAPAAEPAPVAPVEDPALRALSGQVENLSRAVEALKTRAEKAEAEVRALRDEKLAGKVESFVGKKITPAQRDAWLSLARKDEGLFDNLISAQPDLLLDQPVIAERNEARGALEVDKSVKLERLADERVKAAGVSKFEALRQVMLENPQLVDGELKWLLILL